MRFIQREGTVGTVVFAGDSARLLKDGVVVVDWTAGGALTNVPQGAGYTLEVKIGGVVQPSEQIAIGIVVAALGQSNMQIWFRGPTAVPDAADTYQLQANGSWGDVSGSGARAFTALLAQETGVPVAIINSSAGGTGLVYDKGNGRWLDQSAGSLYDNARHDLDATGGKAELVLWMQGESDAGQVTTADYASALTELFGWVESDFAAPHILIGELHKNGYTAADKYAQIRAAQNQVADASATDDIWIGSTATDLETYDGVHLTGASRVAAADRMATTALSLLGIDISRNLISGTAGADVRDGTAGRDEIRGLDGDDSLRGAGNSDALFGGEGSDTLSGGAGKDFLRGENGDDTISGDDGPDVIAGGAGNDLLSGGSDADEIWADRGRDTISGGDGDDVIVGGAGDDTIDGGAGVDSVLYTNRRADYGWSIAGGTVTVEHIAANVAGFDPNKDDGIDILTGVEFLFFSDGVVQLTVNSIPGVLREGTGSADTLTGGLGDDTLKGLGGADTLIGNEGNDWLEGGAGADTLDGGVGVDTMIGGADNDTYRVTVPEDVVIEDASGGGGDTVASKAAYFILPANVEKLLLNSGAGVNDAIGNELDNKLTGNANANRLSGLAGNDTLEGRDGADTLIGGDGIDTASLRGAMSEYEWTVTGQTVTIRDLVTGTDDGTDFLVAVEKLQFSDITVTLSLGAAPGLFTGAADTVDFAAVFAGAYAAGTQYGSLGADDMIVLPIDQIAAIFAGYDLAHSFDAGAGNDRVVGSGLADGIAGGSGNDTLTGGAGDDTLDGGTGDDRAVYSGERSEYDWTVTGNMIVIEHFNPAGASDGVDTLTDIEFLQFSDQVVSLTVPPLFSPGSDVVNFNGVALASYVPGTQYDALDGDDVVTLPASGAAAVSSGYDLGHTFRGGRGDDTIVGGALADNIDGGDDNDSLSGGAGVDTLIGGSGNDLFVVDDPADVVLELAGGGVDVVRSVASAYTLSSNVENLILLGTANISGTGNGLANTLTGNSGNNILAGLDGNDVLDGRDGADTMIGGIGNDVFYVDRPADVVQEAAGAAAGTDTVRSQASTYTLSANIEKLVLLGSANIAGLGNDQVNELKGNIGNNTLYGFGGNDKIDGGAGADTMIGGTGDDVFTVDGAGDIVVEDPGGGTDTVRTGIASYTLPANVEKLILSGTANSVASGNSLANKITGNAGNNMLSGLDGNDLLDGRVGADTMIGGTGDDVFIVDGAGDIVVEDPGGGTDTVRTGIASYTLPANVEKLILSGTANSAASGNSLANKITGNAGNNILSGLDGNDSLDGRVGADTMIGGTGDDVFIVDGAGDIVVEDPGGGTDTVRTGIASYTLPANVEKLILSGTANSVGSGNSLANKITGNAGNNILSGLDGNDSLDGRVGADTMIGGTGDDVFIVDGAGDIVVEDPGGGTDTVRTGIASYTLPANVENLILSGTANSAVNGNSLGNKITGNAGNNMLSGLDGNDWLDGRGGVDTMVGGTGDDVFTVDGPGDIVVEDPGGGTDTVRTGIASYTLPADVEKLALFGTANSAGNGNSLANKITGNAGNNTINGGDGADTLIGAIGADTLTGGTGVDRFEFDALDDSTAAAPDLITDFVQGVDRIDVARIDAVPGGGNDPFLFIGTAGFSGVAGQLRYTPGATTVISADADGDAVADLMIYLTGNIALTASDFFL